MFFKAVIKLKLHGPQPKLRDGIAFANMHLRRFIAFFTEEENFKPANPQYGWHVIFISPAATTPAP